MRRLMMAAVLCVIGTISTAQERVVDTYLAFISGNDIYNSSGVRLTDVGAILQQDRANFHRFGVRDRDDSSDSVFGSLEARQQIPAMVARSFVEPGLAGRIRNGRALVAVTIYAQGNRLTRLGLVTPG